MNDNEFRRHINKWIKRLFRRFSVTSPHSSSKSFTFKTKIAYMNFTAFIKYTGRAELEWASEWKTKMSQRATTYWRNFNVTWLVGFFDVFFIFGSLSHSKSLCRWKILNMDEIRQSKASVRERANGEEERMWLRISFLAYVSSVCIERLISMEQSQWEDMYCLMKRTLSDFSSSSSLSRFLPPFGKESQQNRFLFTKFSSTYQPFNAKTMNSQLNRTGKHLID